MDSLNKMDLIDLYYPTDETIEALLAVPPEQRAALLRHILADVSEAGKDPHISRVLAMIDVLADRTRSWKSDR